jgi:hypothetical protein
MLIVIAKVRRNNQTGGYELVDEGEVLGTFIPGSEFLFEDFVNKEIRMEIRNTEEKETGWKLLNKDGKVRMEELSSMKNTRRLRIESCGMKHDYDLLGVCNKCGKKRGEQ